jgi:hypothetical protein
LENVEQFLKRVKKLVDHALPERDDRVLGDGDELRTDLAAAGGDVAVADAMLVLPVLDPVFSVERISRWSVARDLKAADAARPTLEVR